MFETMQCLTWTVLYYDFDFSKEDLIKFQKQFKVNDKMIDNKNQYCEIYEVLRDTYGLDCRKLALQFPYISKMRIAEVGKKSKQIKSALAGCDNAIEVYLVIALRELVFTWDMTREDILVFFEKIKENSNLYRKGMKNEFVQKYFKDELDLVINF